MLVQSMNFQTIDVFKKLSAEKYVHNCCIKFGDFYGINSHVIIYFFGEIIKLHK